MADLSPMEPILAAASGSIGDIVASRNQHGPYLKARTTPTDPNTPLQQVVRQALATLTDRWVNTLSTWQRRQWDTYANAVRILGRLARSNNIGGLAHYIRANVPRIQAAESALPVTDLAPVPHALPSSGSVSQVVLNTVDQTFHPFFDRSASWTQHPNAGLLFWVSPAQPLTVNYYKGPYRYAGSILGRSFEPASSPGTLPLPFVAGSGQRVFVRSRLLLSNGSLSNDAFHAADEVAQVAPVPTEAHHVAGPPHVFEVLFDQLIRTELHDTANWVTRWTLNTYSTTSIGTPLQPQARIVYSATPVGVWGGANLVGYRPPPFDMNGLLTGLPVVLFTRFPIT